ncbi:MAG: hypothetical protein K2K70_01340 [Lachnospiraceae bacterium]|nr:hypothetical protein [Lachnospiraceae bacterium]
MRIIRPILAAVITLSLVAGYDGVQTEKTVSAAAKKTITVKTDDFTIKLPAGWKNNYVKKSSKGKKHGSYVTFSAKKCYKETGDGFLFSIWRYKDDSYTDLPMYELVGRWNGMNYVAAFPTDIQTMGATKAAKKQYRKLNAASYDASFSIRPVKRTGKNIYRAKGFSLKLPASWKGNYTVKKSGKNEKDSYVSFYAKNCHKEMGAGFLFSIVKYKDDSYQELPAYELVGKWNGVSYVAEFPTDVQFEGASKKAAKQYQTLNKSVEKVVRSIAR